MTRPFPNPIVTPLLDLADQLARQKGSGHVVQVARRRSVSAAYYALFHALCFVCAAGLVGWSRTDLLGDVYRALDHGQAKRRLSDRDAHTIHPAVKHISAAFKLLQEQRHTADYAPPGMILARDKTLALVLLAREAVDLVQTLDVAARTHLAVFLLIARRQS